MRDFLSDCMSDFKQKAKLNVEVPVGDFKQLFCVKCKQQCAHRLSGDPLAQRVATQFDRLVRAQKADSFLPKYAQIVAAEWLDMTKEALKLEIADRRQDWEVPIPIPDTTAVVEEAVKSLSAEMPEDVVPEVWERALELAKAKSYDQGYVEAIYRRLLKGYVPPPEAEDTKGSPPPPAAPKHPKKDPAFRPNARGNAPSQDGMLLGPEGAPLTPKKVPVVDPWAVPVPATSGATVRAGAVLKFGSDGKIQSGETE